MAVWPASFRSMDKSVLAKYSEFAMVKFTNKADNESGDAFIFQKNNVYYRSLMEPLVIKKPWSLRNRAYVFRVD